MTVGLDGCERRESYFYMQFAELLPGEGIEHKLDARVQTALRHDRHAGLPGRHFWLTAILAPRFLASAFAGGPALLILLCLIIRKLTRFDPGREQIQSLAKIVAYAITVNGKRYDVVVAPGGAVAAVAPAKPAMTWSL